MTEPTRAMLKLRQLVSGGQTGVDQGALDAAIALGIPHGGWCPNGRRCETGVIPPQYQLRECASTHYSERTERNVVDSDATLILTHGPLQGGTALTRRLADQYGKPCLVMDAAEGSIALEPVREWLRKHSVQVLNVAGPRESSWPGAQQAARSLICALASSGCDEWSLGDA